MPSKRVTAEEKFELASKYQSLANAAWQYVKENYDTLSAKERSDLLSSQTTLSNHATDLVTQGLTVLVDESKATLAAMQGVISDAEKVLKDIKTAKAALGLVAQVIGLAGSLATGNAELAYQAFVAVQTSVDKLKTV